MYILTAVNSSITYRRRHPKFPSRDRLLKIELGKINICEDGKVLFGLCTVCFNSADPLSTATVLTCSCIHVSDEQVDGGKLELPFSSVLSEGSLLLIICYKSGHDNCTDSDEDLVLQHLKTVVGAAGGTARRTERSIREQARAPLLGHIVELVPKHIKTSTKKRPYVAFATLEDEDYGEDNTADFFSTGVGLFGRDFRTLCLQSGTSGTKAKHIGNRALKNKCADDIGQKDIQVRLRWARATAMTSVSNRGGTRPRGSEVGAGGANLLSYFHFLYKIENSDAVAVASGDDDGAADSTCDVPTSSSLRSHVLYCDRSLRCPWCSRDNTSDGFGRVLSKARTRHGERADGAHKTGTSHQGSSSNASGNIKKKRSRASGSSNENVSSTRGKAPKGGVSNSQECQDIWSPGNCDDLAALLCHLRACHGHFSYEVMADTDSNMHILVSRVIDEGLRESGRFAKSGAGDKGGGLVFYGGSWRDLLGRSSLPKVQVVASVRTKSQHEKEILGNVKQLSQTLSGNSLLSGRGSNDVEDKGNAGSTVVSEGRDMAPWSAHLQPSHARQYYHCSGCAVEPWEAEYESDNDASSRWMHLLSNDLLDEYEDISEREKTFMKMWNTFVNSFPLHADMYVRFGVVLFAKRMAPHIVDRGLRHIFLVHLISLWDFSLISAADIVSSMSLVDKYKASLLVSSGSTESISKAK